VMTYNTYYVFNKGEEETAGIEWVKSRNPDVVGLQELTDIPPERLVTIGKGWGHEHTVLLKTSGFSVGLTSRWPIEVVQKRLEGMHHGYLHARTAGMDVFVIHLSPFDFRKRASEAVIILESVEKLIDEKKKVIVMGDFNAVSPADRKMLAAQADLLERKKESDEKHDHVTNLKEGEIDFAVLEAFFDAGLQDPGLPFFTKQVGSIATIPTGIWSEKKDTAPTTGERIDFILTGPRLSEELVDGRIDRDGEVNRISDHYPVTLDFLTKPSP
jgi:exodeoxyribonuclease-3